MRFPIVICSFVVACGPKPPAEDPTPPPPPDESVIQRPAGPYSPAPVLQLPQDVVESIRQLEVTAADSERLCESVERAASLRHNLGAVLQERYNAVEGTPEEKAFVEALDGITGGVVAIGAGLRGATVSAWLQLPQLMHPKSARDLLEGASEYLGTHAPVYVDAQSESRVCARLGAAEASLHKLAEGWTTAPACVRDALAEDLADVMLRIADVRCFCADKKKALSDVALIAPVLEQLVDLDGPVAAEDLSTGVNGPDAVFGGQCLL